MNLLTSKEAGAACRVPARIIEEAMDAKALAFARLGGQRRIHPADLEDWVRRNTLRIMTNRLIRVGTVAPRGPRISPRTLSSDSAQAPTPTPDRPSMSAIGSPGTQPPAAFHFIGRDGRAAPSLETCQPERKELMD
jgi:excisionase family DNA binding protein